MSRGVGERGSVRVSDLRDLPILGREREMVRVCDDLVLTTFRP